MAGVAGLPQRRLKMSRLHRASGPSLKGTPKRAHSTYDQAREMLAQSCRQLLILAVSAGRATRGARYFNAELLQVEHRISRPPPDLSTTTKPDERATMRRRGSA
jgi:hypothetical protein